MDCDQQLIDNLRDAAPAAPWTPGAAGIVQGFYDREVYLIREAFSAGRAAGALEASQIIAMGGTPVEAAVVTEETIPFDDTEGDEDQADDA